MVKLVDKLAEIGTFTRNGRSAMKAAKKIIHNKIIIILLKNTDSGYNGHVPLIIRLLIIINYKSFPTTQT